MEWRHIRFTLFTTILLFFMGVNGLFLLSPFLKARVSETQGLQEAGMFLVLVEDARRGSLKIFYPQKTEMDQQGTMVQDDKNCLSVIPVQKMYPSLQAYNLSLFDFACNLYISGEDVGQGLFILNQLAIYCPSLVIETDGAVVMSLQNFITLLNSDRQSARGILERHAQNYQDSCDSWLTREENEEE